MANLALVIMWDEHFKFMCDSLMLNVVQYAFWILILLSHLNSQMNDLFDFREEKIMQTSLHWGKFDQVLENYVIHQNVN